MSPTLRNRRTQDGFEQLYRVHVGGIFRYALAVTGDRADAEDVTQTTFMNAYRAFQRGERPQKPENWLISIAHNVCRERFRRAGRRPAEVEFDEDVAAALVPDDGTPTAADIRRALGQLALNQREALVMRELEGRSYADIAEVLGLTVAAVETLIFRARRALREQLEGSLTCSQAEAALSLQLDGLLPRGEAGVLRAHLRACAECSHLARRQRAQRKALRSFALVPLPASLAHWGGAAPHVVAAGTAGAGAGAAGTGAVGTGAAGLSTGVAIKVAAAVAAAAVVGGSGYALVARATSDAHPRAKTGATTAAREPVAQKTSTRSRAAHRPASPSAASAAASAPAAAAPRTTVPRAATTSPAASAPSQTQATTTQAAAAQTLRTATTASHVRAKAKKVKKAHPHAKSKGRAPGCGSTTADPAHICGKTASSRAGVAGTGGSGKP